MLKFCVSVSTPVSYLQVTVKVLDLDDDLITTKTEKLDDSTYDEMAGTW